MEDGAQQARQEAARGLSVQRAVEERHTRRRLGQELLELKCLAAAWGTNEREVASKPLCKRLNALAQVVRQFRAEIRHGGVTHEAAGLTYPLEQRRSGFQSARLWTRCCPPGCPA